MSRHDVDCHVSLRICPYKLMRLYPFLGICLVPRSPCHHLTCVCSCRGCYPLCRRFPSEGVHSSCQKINYVGLSLWCHVISSCGVVFCCVYLIHVFLLVSCHVLVPVRHDEMSVTCSRCICHGCQWSRPLCLTLTSTFLEFLCTTE